MKGKSVVFLGATGAVGMEALKEVLSISDLAKVTTFGRSKLKNISDSRVVQREVNIFDPSTYGNHIEGHEIAICTLGVGEATKVSKEDFIKIDKTAVVDFALKCKEQGVKHFELLASVGINSKSRNYYLRTKGELVDELKRLDFDRLSIFMPSMIITPTNRYGLSQAIFLKIWPIVSVLMIGSWKKYRGVNVEDLGAAMAHNISNEGRGFEALSWVDFEALK